MTFTGMGPDVPSPRLDPNCQCICHLQPGVMHVAACCSAKAPASDAVTLAALTEVQALIAAAYDVADARARTLYRLPISQLYGASGVASFGHLAEVASAAIRSLAPADAIAAREARDEQMRAEGRVAGLREAAEIAGLNAWKHAGEDDYSRGMDAGAAHQVRACCDAIRAHADKIDGDTVKTGGHYRECGE